MSSSSSSSAGQTSRWDALFAAAHHMKTNSYINEYEREVQEIIDELTYEDYTDQENGHKLLDCVDTTLLAYRYINAKETIHHLNERVQYNAQKRSVRGDECAYKQVKEEFGLTTALNKIFQRIKELRGVPEDPSDEVIKKLSARYDQRFKATRAVSSTSSSENRIVLQERKEQANMQQ